MDNINIVEWIGYIGSVIIAISLTMSSIIRLRWLNLLGASIFSTYGFIIGSMPVAFLNMFISMINIFYLVKIYSTKDYFKILQIKRIENRYLQFFLDYYAKDINKFFPGFCEKYLNQSFNNDELLCLFVIRNANVAGLFIGKKISEDEMLIEIDFATPEYRDLKTGRYIYKQNKKFFEEMGVKKLLAHSKNKAHHQYLKRMGFIENDPQSDSNLLVKKTDI